MSIEFTRHVLLWSAVLNYGILLVWFLVFVFMHDSLRHLHGRCFVCLTGNSMLCTTAVWRCTR